MALWRSFFLKAVYFKCYNWNSIQIIAYQNGKVLDIYDVRGQSNFFELQVERDFTIQQMPIYVRALPSEKWLWDASLSIFLSEFLNSREKNNYEK